MMEVETAFKPAVPALTMTAAEFTPDDLAAADQLVQLSVSGGGDEHHDACSSASTLSSPRSVNNAEALVAAPAREDDEEEEGGDENAGVVDRRARKRYRRVSELYAATRRVKTSSDASRGGKRKSSDGIRTAS